MNGVVLADAGPLVAYLDRSDKHHEWAKSQMGLLSSPLVTCEAVMAEAWHLLRRGRINPDYLLGMVEHGALVVRFDLMEEMKEVRRLIRRFEDVPMSLADACLVRMCELERKVTVFTVDSDFSVYRMNGRKVIPVMMPDA